MNWPKSTNPFSRLLILILFRINARSNSRGRLSYSNSPLTKLNWRSKWKTIWMMITSISQFLLISEINGRNKWLNFNQLCTNSHWVLVQTSNQIVSSISISQSPASQEKRWRKKSSLWYFQISQRQVHIGSSMKGSEVNHYAIFLMKILWWAQKRCQALGLP